jgi:DNA-binding transcriptional MerR regulator
MTDGAAGLSIAELASLVGATPRAIRFWVRQGVLPAPELHGPSTRYAPACVARIRAMRALRVHGLALREVARRLRGASDAEIEAWSAGASPAPSAPPSAGPASAPAAPAHGPGAAAERWQRVVLLPGLELHLRDGSGPLLESIAGEIAVRYGGPRDR